MLISNQMLEQINNDRFKSLNQPPLTGTVYCVEYKQQTEFWDWCSDRGVDVQYEGTLYSKPVFSVIYDPHPEFTMLRWA
jgi:hypothetical protein